MGRHGSEEFLTVKEVAARTGRSSDTIRRRLRRNAFPRAVQAGGYANSEWLIPTRDLNEAGLVLPDAATTTSTGDDGSCATHTRLISDLRQKLAHTEGENQALKDEVRWLRELINNQNSNSHDIRRTA